MDMNTCPIHGTGGNGGGGGNAGGIANGGSRASGLGCACSPRPMPMWGTGPQGQPIEVNVDGLSPAPQVALQGETEGGSGSSEGGSSMEGYDGHELVESHGLGCGCKKKKRKPGEHPLVPVFSAPAVQPDEESKYLAVGPPAPYRGPIMGIAAPGKAKKPGQPGPTPAFLKIPRLSGNGTPERPALGSLPDLPTIPVSSAPPVPGPIPPPTYQSPAPGFVPARGPHPGHPNRGQGNQARAGAPGRQENVSADQAQRFLTLAEDARHTLHTAFGRATSVGAKPRDRWAVNGAVRCLPQLTREFGHFSRGLTALRNAVAKKSGLTMDSRDLKAIEDFAHCAKDIKNRSHGLLEADAGVGLGAAGLFVGLLLAIA